MQRDMWQLRAGVHTASPPSSFTQGHYRHKLCMKAAPPLRACTSWLLSDYQWAENTSCSWCYYYGWLPHSHCIHFYSLDQCANYFKKGTNMRWQFKWNEGNKYELLALFKHRLFFCFKKPFKYMLQLSVGNKFQFWSNPECMVYQAERKKRPKNTCWHWQGPSSKDIQRKY